MHGSTIKSTRGCDIDKKISKNNLNPEDVRNESKKLEGTGSVKHVTMLSRNTTILFTSVHARLLEEGAMRGKHNTHGTGQVLMGRIGSKDIDQTWNWYELLL